MIDKKELKKACEILGIGSQVSVSLIKKTYRELSLKYHPDRCKKKNCEKKMKQINHAYKLLLSYAENYLISFSGEEDFDYKTFYEDYFSEKE